MKNRNFRGTLIVVLSIIVLALSIEYVVLAKNADLDSINRGSLWSVSITNVEVLDKKNAVNNKTAFDSFSVSSNDIIKEKDGFIDYKVTIKNKGTLEAKLDDILSLSDDKNLIVECIGLKKYDVMYPGDELNFSIKITYADVITESKSINFKVLLLFVQNN